ncbi:PREDICTED: polycystic kidney disease protein 1-like 1 [Priapulus caudatus]|uniref:Polycystic kidney disease protein 1-like 1 n=1 Tax=Priapulus caudatus TaxID=37621 RepID=A0ABM1EL71_PRICU|nr:PREDICTED: polycystic kidney disease protein 1-like 1 [Priapulus caudatus]
MSHHVMLCCMLQGIAARQRSRYLRFARPPPERQLLEAREQTMKEKQTFRIVGDVVGYALLLATVAAVAFARDRSHMQRLNESVRAAFVRTPVMAFTDIRSPPDWWTWSNTGLLQGLFPDPHTSKVCLAFSCRICEISSPSSCSLEDFILVEYK